MPMNVTSHIAYCKGSHDEAPSKHPHIYLYSPVLCVVVVIMVVVRCSGLPSLPASSIVSSQLISTTTPTSHVGSGEEEAGGGPRTCQVAHILLPIYWPYHFIPLYTIAYQALSSSETYHTTSLPSGVSSLK